jgi:hypothetical protein
MQFGGVITKNMCFCFFATPASRQTLFALFVCGCALPHHPFFPPTPPQQHSVMPPKKTAARSNARPRKRQASNADEQPVKRTRRSTRQTAQDNDEQDDDNEHDDNDEQDNNVQDNNESESNDKKSDEEVMPPKQGEKKGRGVKNGPPTR